jgi:hypothetical protein
MTEIHIETPREIVERLNQLLVEYPEEVKNAVWLELAKVMNESKALCPADTGALRGSGHVTEPVATEGNVHAEIGYSQSYAWYVHENLLAYHNPPTQAKFLEVPLINALPDIQQAIIDRVLASIEGKA